MVGTGAATAPWYDDILGFKVDRTKTYPEFGTRLVLLVRDGFRIEPIEDAKAMRGVARPDARAHISAR
jgi:hypothetical protein